MNDNNHSNKENKIINNINFEIKHLSEINKEQEQEQKSSKKDNNNNNNNKNNVQDLKINYGKYKILKYDSNNEPFLVIGPDYLYFIIIVFLDLLVVIFLSIVQYCYSTLIIRIIGFLLSMFQLFVYIYCSIKNPGFPKRIYQDPSLLNQKEGYYRRCKECGIIVDLRKYPGHCYVCKFCCEGYDHHCSFTTKCIGSGNSIAFKTFLASFFILICYFAISALWFEPSRNKCRFNFF